MGPSDLIAQFGIALSLFSSLILFTVEGQAHSKLPQGGGEKRNVFHFFFFFWERMEREGRATLFKRETKDFWTRRSVNNSTDKSVKKTKKKFSPIR